MAGVQGRAWIALKFEKGATLGSAGLSINLLTNILYRQAAALHPNTPTARHRPSAHLLLATPYPNYDLRPAAARARPDLTFSIRPTSQHSGRQ